MPDRGMRTEAHLRNHLAPRLALHSENPMVELSVNNFVHVRYPIRNSLGFYNLDKFFTSNIEDLRVLKVEGGD